MSTEEGQGVSGGFRKVIDGVTIYWKTGVVLTAVVLTLGVFKYLDGMEDSLREHVTRIEQQFTILGAHVDRATDAIERNQATISELSELTRTIVEGRLDNLERIQDRNTERVQALDRRITRLEP